jgi:hypothetical protein
MEKNNNPSKYNLNPLLQKEYKLEKEKPTKTGI